MVLRRGQLPAHQIPLELNKSTAPIDVAPLKRQQFPCTHPGSKTAQEPRIPFRVPSPSRLEDMHDFVPREWIDARLGIVAGPEVLAEAECGIGQQQFIVDGLREDGAERPRNTAYGAGLQPFSTAAGDQLAA